MSWSRNIIIFTLIVQCFHFFFVVWFRFRICEQFSKVDLIVLFNNFFEFHLFLFRKKKLYVYSATRTRLIGGRFFRSRVFFFFHLISEEFFFILFFIVKQSGLLTQFFLCYWPNIFIEWNRLLIFFFFLNFAWEEYAKIAQFDFSTNNSSF